MKTTTAVGALAIVFIDEGKRRAAEWIHARRPP
jgi:hypothetical protein